MSVESKTLGEPNISPKMFSAFATTFSALVSLLKLFKECGEKLWGYFDGRNRKRMTAVLLVAYKYYDKICVVRQIKRCCSQFDIDNADLLLDINRLICGHMANLHRCDHVDLDLSDISNTLGDKSCNYIRELERLFGLLDAKGVDQQCAFSTVANDVARIATEIIMSWDGFVAIGAKKLSKSVEALEQLFYDKANPV